MLHKCVQGVFNSNKKQVQVFLRRERGDYWQYKGILRHKSLVQSAYFSKVLVDFLVKYFSIQHLRIQQILQYFVRHKSIWYHSKNSILFEIFTMFNHQKFYSQALLEAIHFGSLDQGGMIFQKVTDLTLTLKNSDFYYVQKSFNFVREKLPQLQIKLKVNYVQMQYRYFGWVGWRVVVLAWWVERVLKKCLKKIFVEF